MKIPTLNIQQFDKEEPLTNFYSNTFPKHVEVNRNHFYKPHSHDFFLCVFFFSGTGEHEIDFNTYAIEPGTLFFLRPGQTHFWKFDKVPEGYIFFHTQEFYELNFLNHKLSSFPFWFSHNNPPVIKLSPKKLIRTRDQFKEINSEYATNKPFKKLKLANLLNLVYIELSREYSEEKLDIRSTYPAYIKTLGSLEALIENFFHSEKSAKFYADKLNISTKHLNRITKETLNKTTTDLISERVILEAKRLLVHSPNTFSRISEMLGFSDYAYFSRVFKSRTGMTPLSFKRGYQ